MLFESKGKYGASVLCLFNKNAELLMLKRSKDDDWKPLHWAFVGGKIQKNEDPEDAIVRETFEEVGIEIDKKDLIKVHTDRKVHFFVCRLLSNPKVKLDKEENSLSKWTTLDDLDKMKLVPDTKENLRKALRKLNKSIQAKWDET